MTLKHLRPSDTELPVGHRILHLKVIDFAIPRPNFNLSLHLPGTDASELFNFQDMITFLLLSLLFFTLLDYWEANWIASGIDRVCITWMVLAGSRVEITKLTVLSIRVMGRKDRDVGYLIKPTWSSSLTIRKILYYCISTSCAIDNWSSSPYVVFCLTLFLLFVRWRHRPWQPEQRDLSEQSRSSYPPHVCLPALSCPSTAFSMPVVTIF